MPRGNTQHGERGAVNRDEERCVGGSGDAAVGDGRRRPRRIAGLSLRNFAKRMVLILLAAVLGALFVGVGIGIVIRQGASAGGDDALALSISKVLGWRVGRCYLFTDLTVLALSLTYIPVRSIAFSLVTVMVSSAVIDVVKDASWDHVEAFADWVRERRGV